MQSRDRGIEGDVNKGGGQEGWRGVVNTAIRGGRDARAGLFLVVWIKMMGRVGVAYLRNSFVQGRGVWRKGRAVGY